MKKIVKAIMALAAVTAASGFLAGCGSGNGEEGSGIDVWEDAEIFAEYAGKTVSWGKETGTDVDGIQVSTDITGRLQAGSRVVFELKGYDNDNGDGKYLKFQVTQGGWSACGVDKYYDDCGTAIDVVENADNPGVYESSTAKGAVAEGAYYFEVTEDNVETLRQGFGFQGRLTLVKLGITDLLSEVYDPDSAIELSEPAAKEGYLRFWAQKSAKEMGSAQLVLNYEHEVLDQACKLTDVDIEYILNDGEAEHYVTAITISRNDYGSDYQAKVDILPDVKVTKNDVVYVKITAKVNVEAAASIIQANLIDTSAAANYWAELCRQDEEGTENGIFEQKQIVTSGITYEEEQEAEGGEDGKTTLLSNLSLGWSGSDTITEGVTVKAGDVIYFTLTATGSNECQFIKKGWNGGLGKNVITILDADGNDVTYYAGAENCTEDEKDRPAVSLSDTTATFHFTVTDAFLELKDVAAVVGTATVNEMYLMASE